MNDAIEKFCILFDWDYSPENVINVKKIADGIIQIFTDDGEEYFYDIFEDYIL